jgi:hypothetical protein
MFIFGNIMDLIGLVCSFAGGFFLARWIYKVKDEPSC